MSPLLESFPELPLLVAVALAALGSAVLRRALVGILLTCVVLLVASMVVHWPPVDLAAVCLAPGTLDR